MGPFGANAAGSSIRLGGSSMKPVIGIYCLRRRSASPVCSINISRSSKRDVSGMGEIAYEKWVSSNKLEVDEGHPTNYKPYVGGRYKGK